MGDCSTFHAISLPSQAFIINNPHSQSSRRGDSLFPLSLSLLLCCPRRVAFLCCVSERFAAATHTHTVTHTLTLWHTHRQIQRVSVSGRNSARQKWAFVCANLYLAVDTPWQRCRPASNTNSYNNNSNTTSYNNSKQKTSKKFYL